MGQRAVSLKDENLSRFLTEWHKQAKNQHLEGGDFGRQERQVQRS